MRSFLSADCRKKNMYCGRCRDIVIFDQWFLWLNSASFVGISVAMKKNQLTKGTVAPNAIISPLSLNSWLIGVSFFYLLKIFKFLFSHCGPCNWAPLHYAYSRSPFRIICNVKQKHQKNNNCTLEVIYVAYRFLSHLIWGPLNAAST